MGGTGYIGPWWFQARSGSPRRNHRCRLEALEPRLLLHGQTSPSGDDLSASSLSPEAEASLEVEEDDRVTPLFDTKAFRKRSSAQPGLSRKCARHADGWCRKASARPTEKDSVQPIATPPISLGVPDPPARELGTVLVGAGFSNPVFATSPPGDIERLFVVEQYTGRIKILHPETGVINPAPFLDIDGLSRGFEQGLLGLAFHPDYATNGYFYIHFNDSFGDTQIERYQVSANDPDLADPNSGLPILSIDQPFSNHNGGWIGFGPDDYLYLGMGDGGSGGDPGNRAQDITNQPLGKILRIDVNTDQFPGNPNRHYAIPPTNPFVDQTGDDEIWAYGVRNPWRMSFDRETGDLYFGDVGQLTREEVSFQPASSTGGENYGWRIMEGDHCFDNNQTTACFDSSLVPPIHDYPRSEGTVVTGGYAYRGPIDQLQGKYFFGDYARGHIWSLEHDGTNVTEFLTWTGQFTPTDASIDAISSFGEDGLGNLYIVDYVGEIFQVVEEFVGMITVSVLQNRSCRGAYLEGFGRFPQ